MDFFAISLSARRFLEEDVVVAVGVERGIEVDEVYTLSWEVPKNLQVVAVVEGVGLEIRHE